MDFNPQLISQLTKVDALRTLTLQTFTNEDYHKLLTLQQKIGDKRAKNDLLEEIEEKNEDEDDQDIRDNDNKSEVCENEQVFH